MNSVLSVFTAVQGASAPWFAGLCRELYTFFTYIRQVLWFCIRVAAVIQGGPWSSGTVRASVHFDSVTAAKAASLSLRFTTALGVLQGIVLGTFSGY